jgi:transcription termination factor Rho
MPAKKTSARRGPAKKIAAPVDVAPQELLLADTPAPAPAPAASPAAPAAFAPLVHGAMPSAEVIAAAQAILAAAAAAQALPPHPTPPSGGPAAAINPPAPQPAAPARAPAPTTAAPAVATPASAQPSPKPPAPPPPAVENLLQVEGILDIDNVRGGNGALLDPTKNGRRRPADTFVPKEMIRRFRLKQGSIVRGTAFPPEGRFPNPKMKYIEAVDGIEVEDRFRKLDFTQLTTVSPDQQLKLETKDGRLTTRVVDLFCPIGKGTRGLIVAPPRTGKTTLLRDMALGVIENHPECQVMILLVDERPEEVTDFRRNVAGAEVWASSNDDPVENHIRVADLAIERARRLVEVGRDVVLFIDSLTRLSRAHNTAKNSGRTGSGGLDVRALEKPRQLFASARRTEEAGSLTIIASILVETGSRMDDVIFQEFKGTGNSDLILDRKCAELRLWPAVNIQASGTRKEELLVESKRLETIHFFRRALVQAKIEEACETAISRLSKTKTNDEFIKLIGR